MKKLSVKSSWLLICAIGICITSVSFLFYSMYVKNAVQKSEKNTTLKETAYIQTMLNDTWDGIFDLSTELYLDHSAAALSDAHEPQEFYARGGYQFVQEMKKYLVFNPFLSDIMVYYPDSDYIVGSFGIYSPYDYWLVSYGATPFVEYDIWKSTLLSYRDTGFFTAFDGINHSLFLYFSRPETHNWCLVAKISRDEIIKRLEWASRDSSNDFIAVADEDGNIYGSVGNQGEFVDPVTHKLNTVLEKRYVLTRQEANIQGIYYLVIKEKSLIHNLSSTIQIFAIIVLIASCLISIIATLFLIRQHSVKLNQLVSVFDQFGKPYRNEYDLLESGIRGLLRSQEELAVLSSRQQILIEQSFLNELLFRFPINTQNIEDVAAYYKIPLENKYYGMIVQKSAESISDEQIILLLLGWVDPAEVFWTRKDGLDIFLLNFDDADMISFHTFADKLQEITPLLTPRAISKIIDVPMQIGQCWIECLRELGCSKLLKEAGKKDIVSQQTDTLITNFQKKLEERDFDGLHQIAPILYDQYIRNSDPFLFSCRKYYVANLIIPYCSAQALSQIEHMAAAQNRESWLSAMNFVLAVCNSESYSAEHPSDREIANRVRSIINLQYNNPALDLRMLADAVGYSQSYTSRIFKEKFGINISQYINQVRINAAKEMVLNGNDNIKSIAIKVGFAGDTQFIRTFKRLEKMTPGSYRNNNTTDTKEDNR